MSQCCMQERWEVSHRANSEIRGIGETVVAGEDENCQNLIQYYLEYVVLSDKSNGREKKKSRFTNTTNYKSCNTTVNTIIK